MKISGARVFPSFLTVSPGIKARSDYLGHNTKQASSQKEIVVHHFGSLFLQINSSHEFQYLHSPLVRLQWSIVNEKFTILKEIDMGHVTTDLVSSLRI